MTECKRCGKEIEFNDGKCFDLSTTNQHFIWSCKTKDDYIWCPIHRDIFSKNNPCEHYNKFGYIPNNSEQFFINLIKEGYEPGDFLIRKRWRKKSGDKMKNPKCLKCNVSLKNMSEPNQKLHEQNHINEEKNQANMFSYF